MFFLKSFEAADFLDIALWRRVRDKFFLSLLRREKMVLRQLFGIVLAHDLRLTDDKDLFDGPFRSLAKSVSVVGFALRLGCPRGRNRV